ncbi:MAG: cupin domain-containing protein [Candidatus Riflebacteria bacterium HGW-Riflebacteria-1]|jgi:quercetin dioxygenase-like cupin family protein|nr:MAG: cupin domain-containing protein [Candidatus Riflebacteria bacterium HGW-Riflebacteria-1]
MTQVWKTEEVLNFADSVTFASGSIVSKTLFDKPAGSLTLFAIAEGQGIAEHKSPYDATVQVLDGEGEFQVAANVYKVKAGEGLIMPANVPHAVLPGQGFKMLLIMIRSKND